VKIIPEIKDEFFSYPEAGQMEAKILDVFCTYCADATITKTLLVKLLRQTNIMYQQHTIYDCKMAFTKAQLLAKTRGCYKSGVIANKFLTYRVFREVLIPCLAERFACPDENILEALRKLESENIPAMSAAGTGITGLFMKGAISRKIGPTSMKNMSFSCENSEYDDI
jgi:hypothetical protein